MNKSLIVGIAVIVFIATSIGVYSLNNAKNNSVVLGQVAGEESPEHIAQEKEAAMKEDAMSKKNGGVTTDKSSSIATMKVGSYEPYASAKIALASSSHNVVLFFRASWCPTCRAIDADIKAHLKDIPASLTILDVDYDNSTELKKKYGVTYQHTFVQVDAQGNMIKKWSGGLTLTSLVSEVK